MKFSFIFILIGAGRLIKLIPWTKLYFLIAMSIYVDFSVIPIILVTIAVIGPMFSASNQEKTINLFMALFYFTQLLVQGYSDW